jgi:hypothetical protein
MDALQLGRQLSRTSVKASLGVDAAEDLTQYHREVTQCFKSRYTVSRRTRVSVARLRGVSKRCPVLELFVGILELDRYEGVRLLDTDRAALIQTLDFVHHCFSNYSRPLKSRIKLTKSSPEDPSPNLIIFIGKLPGAGKI